MIYKVFIISLFVCVCVFNYYYFEWICILHQESHLLCLMKLGFIIYVMVLGSKLEEGQLINIMNCSEIKWQDFHITS